MANNNKFNDVAVGYRPQTAFPLNANEYFESLAAASAAVSSAAEVGTAEANRTSYYIGQTVTVYDKDEGTVSMRQIQPDGTLKPVGQGIQEIPVDGVSIGKEADGTLYLKAVPDGMLDPATIYKEDGKIALKAVPEDMLTGYGYVKLSSLTGYIEPSGEQKYKIQTAQNGAAYVHVPWTGGGGGISLSDVQATIFDFGNGDLSAFGWEGELSQQNLIDAGIKDSSGAVVKNPVAVRIGSGATNIGGYAFSGCSDLTNVTIPNSVTSIGPFAFAYCHSLSSVIIPNGVTNIKQYAFSGCSDLINVTIPNSVTSIGYAAFNRCSSLSSVTIPNSVTSIGPFAFAYWSSLSNVTIPNSVTSIGTDAFQFCNQNLSITFKDYYDKPLPAGFPWGAPTATSSIWNDAGQEWVKEWVQEQGFAGGGISLSDVQATIFDFGGGDLSAFDWTGELNQQDLIDAGIKDSSGAVVKSPVAVRIGNGITSIGNSAFRNCSGLSSVTIPYGVTSIQTFAFKECEGLTSVTIPDSVMIIYSWAFQSCRSLTSVTIPNSVTSIQHWAFEYCSGLFEITVEGKTQAEAEALLANASLPAGCRIMTWNFEPRRNYAVPVFEQNYTNVNLAGRKLYYPAICQEERIVDSTDSMLVWRVMFMQSKHQSGTLVFKVSDGSDSGVILSANMLSDTVFSYTTIDWPYPVTDYLSVTNITGTAATANIDVLLRGYEHGYPDAKPYTYYGVSGEVDMDMYSNAKKIGAYAFNGVSGLMSTREHVEFPKAMSVGRCAFEKLAGVKTIDLGNVYEIGDAAFRYMLDLVSANIGNNIVDIPVSAFYNCRKLSSVTIPNSVTSIGDYAFYYCNRLSSVTIPDGVTSIGNHVFYRCSYLSGITIPDSVISIGYCAFEDCDGLTSMTIPDRVTSIGERAFCDCSRLSNVTIGNSVTSIERDAFSGCTSLTSVTIPNSVTSIGMQAFYFCNKLSSVIFEGNAPTVGTNAFTAVASGCKAWVYLDKPFWSSYSEGDTWNGLTIADLGSC